MFPKVTHNTLPGIILFEFIFENSSDLENLAASFLHFYFPDGLSYIFVLDLLLLR